MSHYSVMDACSTSVEYRNNRIRQPSLGIVTKHVRNTGVVPEPLNGQQISSKGIVLSSDERYKNTTFLYMKNAVFGMSRLLIR
jgi:hypothetical protein